MSASVQCEALAATSLREWLLLQLPAKVAEVNGLRPAVLKAPWAGPYVIPAGRTLGFTTATGNAFTSAAITAGTRTAAQLAADVNAVAVNAVASADSAGRFVLTSTLPPTVPVPSLVRVRPGNNADINGILGWALGGELEVRTALVPPFNRGVHDGWPALNDLLPNAQGSGGMIVVVLGDRDSVPARPGPRGDMFIVILDVSVLRVEPAQQLYRTREHIQAAVRCVREVLMQDAGRLLGNYANGIQLVTEGKAHIAGKPLSFGNPKSPSPFFDAAVFTLAIKVHERPAPT